ncbi:MAG: FmdB family transcriptional regulator [Actinomycetales bacterium TMED115]|nr:MAG: FmdB family transcriptional regulator [Actinomycetales bacterium TMED115]
MPTYEYACSSCDTTHDIVQPMTDSTLTECPACGEPTLRKLFNGVGVVFKGSGFYRNDSRSSGSSQDSPSKDSAGTSDKKSSSDSGGSSGSSSSGSSDSGSTSSTSSKDSGSGSTSTSTSSASKSSASTT